MTELPSSEDDRVVEQYGRFAHDGLDSHERYVVDTHFSTRGATVLDLGCATGRTTAPLAERGFDVVGVDLTEPFVERAREEHPSLPFQVGDATDLQFPESTFECVLFARLGIDDIPTKAGRMRALLEAWRVLKPGACSCSTCATSTTASSSTRVHPRSDRASSGSSSGTSVPVRFAHDSSGWSSHTVSTLSTPSLRPHNAASSRTSVSRCSTSSLERAALCDRFAWRRDRSSSRGNHRTTEWHRADFDDQRQQAERLRHASL